MTQVAPGPRVRACRSEVRPEPAHRWRPPMRSGDPFPARLPVCGAELEPVLGAIGERSLAENPVDTQPPSGSVPFRPPVPDSSPRVGARLGVTATRVASASSAARGSTPNRVPSIRMRSGQGRACPPRAPRVAPRLRCLERHALVCEDVADRHPPGGEDALGVGSTGHSGSVCGCGLVGRLVAASSCGRNQ